jgi:hypothetical protein
MKPMSKQFRLSGRRHRRKQPHQGEEPMKRTARLAFTALVVAGLMGPSSVLAQDNPPAAPPDAPPMMMEPDAGAAPEAGGVEPPMQMAPTDEMMGQMGMMQMMMMMQMMAEMMELCMQMMQSMMGGDAGGNP